MVVALDRVVIVVGEVTDGRHASPWGMRSSTPRALASVLAVSAIAFLAACGDSTAPEKTLSVAITVNQAPAARFETDPSGQQIIVCDLDLIARATGTGKAVWEDAVARFYFGKDRSAAVDSIPISRDNARQLW